MNPFQEQNVPGFFYLRHGITEANQQGRYCGCGWDIPLAPEGHEQANRIAAQIIKFDDRFAEIRASPALRVRETVEIVNRELKLPVTIIDGLKEIDYGQWDRKLESENPWLDKSIAPPGGESYPAFRNRIASAMEEILGSTRDVLIVAHGHVWIAITDLMGIENQIGNCVLAEVSPVRDFLSG